MLEYNPVTRGSHRRRQEGANLLGSWSLESLSPGYVRQRDLCKITSQISKLNTTVNYIPKFCQAVLFYPHSVGGS